MKHTVSERESDEERQPSSKKREDGIQEMKSLLQLLCKKVEQNKQNTYMQHSRFAIEVSIFCLLSINIHAKYIARAGENL